MTAALKKKLKIAHVLSKRFLARKEKVRYTNLAHTDSPFLSFCDFP
jgi:hypothetical protein